LLERIPSDLLRPEPTTMTGALVLSAIVASTLATDGSSGARLLREPDISRYRIAFIHAGDLWTAPRGGGPAHRLTTTAGVESSPRFSPDGTWIAFTRHGDIYVLPAEGGEERRLTWHPSNDRVAGWTPDGRRLLVHSDRLRGALTQFPRLFLLPLEGGTPEPLPMPRGTHGSFSPDGGRIAYGPSPEVVLWLPWKRYRGGSLGYVAIYDLERKRYEELPRVAANDVCPMWHGGAIYFASDRDGIMNLYRYDLTSKRTERLTQYTEWDVKNPSLGPDAIVYENAGWLYSFDLSTRSIRRISVSLPPEAAPRVEESAKWRQALDDVWRAYREHAFSPAPGWDGAKPRYEALMASAADSSDAEYVLTEYLGEASQSHIILERDEDAGPTRSGLLGADYRAAGGYYRIEKIYRGEDTDEKKDWPLGAPGLKVSEGDYLIAAEGKPIPTGVDVSAAFAGLAGKEVKLRVNHTPSPEGSWEIVVKTITNEASLRYMDWVRANRARVTEATDGKVGYIHVMNADDVDGFKKEWSAQRGRAAVIIDIRNNVGGGGAEEIIDWIGREPASVMYDRRGRVPPAGHFLDGPKVMIADEKSVSGGDQLALLFKHAKVGPLVGNRTFGAMIGSGAPHKITGGWVLFVPEYGFYRHDVGEWCPENLGVEPDYAVPLRPHELSGGHDPQLEKAIELATEAIRTYETRIPAPPPYNPGQ
jgi:C-terminal processing protease CtpA/Prc/Tol biopolymer transport system component